MINSPFWIVYDCVIVAAGYALLRLGQRRSGVVAMSFGSLAAILNTVAACIR